MTMQPSQPLLCIFNFRYARVSLFPDIEGSLEVIFSYIYPALSSQGPITSNPPTIGPPCSYMDLYAMCYPILLRGDGLAWA